MTRRFACKMLRAAVTISNFNSAEDVSKDCEDCPWWDSRAEDCGVRLISMAPVGEFILNSLNSKGLSDSQVAKLLGVDKSSVSRWHSRLERMPEKRARQLYELKERLKAGDEDLGDIAAKNRAYRREEVLGRVRYLLSWLKRLGRNGTSVAGYFGVSRSTVSKWRTGQNVPSNETLEALAELLEEERERWDRLMGSPGGEP